ncbi:hypothetical protein [Ruegeria atlantica]|uniref:hypothetical protein n=1 Tax=Ruegeria atlantica TaxID=81569 RepID=UPI00147B8678|nr:hypothetical protein [Ruegeria atlantica]
MTVRELIERLSEFPAREEIRVEDVRGGTRAIEGVGLSDGIPAIFARMDFEADGKPPTSLKKGK